MLRYSLPMYAPLEHQPIGCHCAGAPIEGFSLKRLGKKIRKAVKHAGRQTEKQFKRSASDIAAAGSALSAAGLPLFGMPLAAAGMLRQSRTERHEAEAFADALAAEPDGSRTPQLTSAARGGGGLLTPTMPQWLWIAGAAVLVLLLLRRRS